MTSQTQIEITPEAAAHWSDRIAKLETEISIDRYSLMELELSISLVETDNAQVIEKMAEEATDKSLSTVEKRRLATMARLQEDADYPGLIKRQRELKDAISTKIISRDHAERTWRTIYAFARREVA